jgi:hypothetical protein
MKDNTEVDLRETCMCVNYEYIQQTHYVSGLQIFLIMHPYISNKIKYHASQYKFIYLFITL